MQNSKFRRGILLGIFVGIIWGLDGVLMGRVGQHEIFAGSGFSPLVTAFFHEGFCFFWVALVLAFRKQLRPVFHILFRTKKGRATALAALVGSPIGMSAYLLGIQFATAPYASSISVIYPGVGAVISYFVLKEKLCPRAILGISVSILGSFMLGFLPSGTVPPTFALGIFFSCLAVLGWALEGVLIGYVMKKAKPEDQTEATPQQLLCIRYLVSMVAYAVLVLPLMGGYPLAGEIIRTGLVFRYAGIAVLGALTYLCWYQAVDLIGAAMGTALNSTAALWTIIFTAILFDGTITPRLAFWGVVIVTGVFIFALDPKAFRKKGEGKC